MNGDEVVERARALVGTPFRPQGRVADVGLDCVGTAAAAAGCDLANVPSDYRLGGWVAEDVEHELGRAGLTQVGEAQPGDVVLMRVGARQLHLAVLTGDGFVHADAGIGRVVERPGAVPWPVLSWWRMVEQEGAD